MNGVGNLEEYEDPNQYDHEYGGFTDDMSFYFELAQKSNGPILDLACGTGRLTIPIANLGFEITGLDLSEPMLKKAREKSKGLNINWIREDFRDFNLGKRFSLILMASNAFQALLTKKDQTDFFQCVRQHLTDDGILAFDTRNMHLEELKNFSDKYEYWHEFDDISGEKVQVFGKHSYDFESQIATYETLRKWPSHSKKTLIQLRYVTQEQLTDLLDENGFKNINLYGDFSKRPLDEKSQKIVVVVT